MVVTPSRYSPELSPAPSPLHAWVRLLRPRQWIKNLVVFAGMVFKPIYTLDAFLITLAVFAAFCAVSSAGYIVNDVLDAEKDRLHPAKRLRPIAAGLVKPVPALVVAACLIAGSLALALAVHLWTAFVLLAYLVLTLGYSLGWKHQVILDVFLIGAGFLLRAWAGTTGIEITLSPWLFVCLLLLSLMLGLGKRRHELNVVTEDPGKHRPVLQHYSRGFIDQAMTTVLSGALVSYALYAITSPTAQHHPGLVYTVPIVCYAMLRYLYLVMHADQGGKPEEIFLTDTPMIVAILLWGLVVIGVFLLG